MAEQAKQQPPFPVFPKFGGRSAAADWRRWRRYWLRDPLLGGLNYLMYQAARRLPIGWCSALGGGLGAVNGRFRFQLVRDRVRRGYLHLAGEHAGDPDRFADRFFAHLGRVMMEFSALDRLWAAGHIAVEGGEHLAAALAAGRPVIVMGVHTGNWEVIGPSLIALGHRFKFIYQPPRSRFEHAIAAAARRRYGAVLLQPGIAAARIAHRLLAEERGILLIYADDERKGYVNAPLFGRPLRKRANLLIIARLAAASGAVVIPAIPERIAQHRHRLIFLPAVALGPVDGPNPQPGILENVHRLDAAITPAVLARLDQWYMLVDFYRSQEAA